jgi:hypothetical protein
MGAIGQITPISLVRCDCIPPARHHDLSWKTLPSGDPKFEGGATAICSLGEAPPQHPIWFAFGKSYSPFVVADRPMAGQTRWVSRQVHCRRRQRHTTGPPSPNCALKSGRLAALQKARSPYRIAASRPCACSRYRQSSLRRPLSCAALVVQHAVLMLQVRPGRRLRSKRQLLSHQYKRYSDPASHTGRFGANRPQRNDRGSLQLSTVLGQLHHGA